MTRLNEVIQEYWPCMPCVGCGYLCFPCSFFNWFPTNWCINESEKHAIEFLNQVNQRQYFTNKNISFHLKKTCCSSYISISIPYLVWTEGDSYRTQQIAQSINTNDDVNMEGGHTDSESASSSLLSTSAAVNHQTPPSHPPVVSSQPSYFLSHCSNSTLLKKGT